MATSWRRALRVCLALAVTAGTGAMLATPLQVAADTPVSVPGGVTIDTSTPYVVALAASALQAAGNQSVTLVATTVPATLPAGYHIDVYNLSTGWEQFSCFQNPCTGNVSNFSGTYTYQAFLDGTGTLAESNTVTVTWAVPAVSRPSSSCAQPVLGGPVAGLDTTLAVSDGSSQTVVCFRVDDSLDSGVVVGGAVVINESVPSLPNLVDGNLCRDSTGAQTPGNNVQTPHPLAAPQVLGSEIAYLDVYSGSASNGATWVCTATGSTAKTLVFQGLSGVPNVGFMPDSDSIVQ